MLCYRKAYDLGDVSALNNIALMQEQGYEDVPPQPELALLSYKEAHSMRCSDATINLALYHLNDKF